jgi:hypothetical protein
MYIKPQGKITTNNQILISGTKKFYNFEAQIKAHGFKKL